MKQGILFDLIGTLLVANTRLPMSSVYERLVNYGLASSEDSFISAWNEEESRASQFHHTPFEERIERVSNKVNWKIEWNQITVIANDICDNAEKVLTVDNDANKLLMLLQSKVKLGLVTNYDHPPAIYKLLSATKLDQYFSVVIISGEVGIWKPDPKILLKAINGLLLNPSQCYYVGDSSTDIDVAIASGVTPILINRLENSIDPFRESEGNLELRYHELIMKKKLHIIRKLNEIESFI